MIFDRRCVVLLLWAVFNGVDSSIIRRPEDTEVRVGDSTYLNCSFSDATAPKSWYHYPVGKGANEMRYVYADDQLFSPYDDRFRIDTTSSDGASNLVMNRVESPDAGRYVCQNNGEPETAELIVLESTPRCMSNIDSNGIVGSNSCGREKETIQLSCVVSYSGNIPPNLQWTRVKNGKASAIDDSLLSCLPSDGRIACNYTAETDIELDGSHFVCQTSRATNTQYHCSTESVRILYSIGNKTRIAKSVGDEVTCSIANSSSSDCSYSWIWFDGDLEETVSKNATLVIDREGLYRCEARCSIKEFVCRVSTTLVKASSAPGALTTNTTTGLIIGCVILGVSFICLCAFVVIKMIRNKTARRKIVMEQIAEMMKLLKTEDQLRQNAAEIETLKADLAMKNGNVDELNAIIKARNEEIEELRNQATRPTASRGLLVATDFEAMETCSDDNQHSTSTGCDDQKEWTCKTCVFTNTSQNCQVCKLHRESQ